MFVQSIDKNICVPVGGVTIASFNKEIFAKLGEICCGKSFLYYLSESIHFKFAENMSVSPATDVVITLLRMGKKKYLSMLDDCEAMYGYLREEISKLGEKYDEKVIENAGNPISIGKIVYNLSLFPFITTFIALTLTNIPEENLTEIGSMLYTRNISGARVVTTTEVKNICDFRFERMWVLSY